MPDPTEQLSEKTPSEEYLPQAAYYPSRKGHFIKHALRSSGEGQLCTARKALARKGASPSGTCLTESCKSASVQEMERVGKQPCQMVAQSFAANKLKPWDKPEVLTPSTQTRRAKATHLQGGERKGTLGPMRLLRETVAVPHIPMDPNKPLGVERQPRLSGQNPPHLLQAGHQRGSRGP